MLSKTRENPGTVLLLKLPIQERDEEDKREEVEGRWSTEALCVRPATDAGAAWIAWLLHTTLSCREGGDALLPQVPRAPSSAFMLIYSCCHSV